MVNDSPGDAAAWHWIDKAYTHDAIYNIVSASLGPVDTDRNIGQEFDLVATCKYSKTLRLQAGYFWFSYGDGVDQTPLSRPDAQQFYFMTTWGF